MDEDAAAERMAALRAASYFAERKGRADWVAFNRLMGETWRRSAATW